MPRTTTTLLLRLMLLATRRTLVFAIRLPPKTSEDTLQSLVIDGEPYTRIHGMKGLVIWYGLWCWDRTIESWNIDFMKYVQWIWLWG